MIKSKFMSGVGIVALSSMISACGNNEPEETPPEPVFETTSTAAKQGGNNLNLSGQAGVCKDLKDYYAEVTIYGVKTDPAGKKDPQSQILSETVYANQLIGQSELDVIKKVYTERELGDLPSHDVLKKAKEGLEALRENAKKQCPEFAAAL